MKRTTPVRRFAICLNNRNHAVSLERWKIYRVLPDREGAAHRQLRVVDESGRTISIPQHTSDPYISRRPWLGCTAERRGIDEKARRLSTT